MGSVLLLIFVSTSPKKTQKCSIMPLAEVSLVFIKCGFILSLNGNMHSFSFLALYFASKDLILFSWKKDLFQTEAFPTEQQARNHCPPRGFCNEGKNVSTSYFEFGVICRTKSLRKTFIQEYTMQSDPAGRITA